MLNNLLRYKKNQKYLVFDYETEGLNLHFSRPFQLSFIVGDINDNFKEYDYYIDIPDLKVSDEAAKVTRFSWEKYNRLKQDKELVLNEFEKYLYDEEYLIVGHNILGFDVYLHNTHRRLCGRQTDYSYLDRLIDTNCIAKSIKMSIGFDEDMPRIQKMYKLQSIVNRKIRTRLEALLKENNIDFDKDKLHDSLYDIQKNFDLFRKQLWQTEII
jgi:DNA polymerase III epsilon subunit-like protein